MNLLKTRIEFREFFLIAISFIVFTIIGTLSHEYGHIIVAKYLGYETKLHYGSMTFKGNNDKLINDIYFRNKFAITNNKNYSEKEHYDQLIEKTHSDSLAINIGGPIQTIVTGTIGFILLLYRSKLIYRNGLKILDWIYIFLSLFWLRQVFNLVMSIGNAIYKSNNNYFGGDERRIASALEIHEGSLAIPLAIFGLFITIYIVFKIIPLEKRLNFILGGLCGGILGFFIWLRFLGQILLP